VLDRRLGPIKAKESLRKLTRLLSTDPHARVLRSTVQRTSGAWVISFTVRRSPKARRARRPKAAVGVDVGLARLATPSTGHAAANARPLQASLRSLRRLQRRLDRQRRANNPGNYLPDGRVKLGRRPGTSLSGWFAPSGGSPDCTRAWRTCVVSRRTGSRRRLRASSASSASRRWPSRT